MGLNFAGEEDSPLLFHSRANFFFQIQAGSAEIQFARDDIAKAARELGVNLPKTLVT